jgi:hypothetical protein
MVHLAGNVARMKPARSTDVWSEDNLRGGRHECSLRNRFCSQVFRTFQEHSHTIHLGTSHKQRVRKKITNLQNINKLKGLINHTLKKKQQNGRGTKLYQFIKCRS